MAPYRGPERRGLSGGGTLLATYRVKPGHVLPHEGVLLEPGTELELPASVAEDVEVHYRIERVADATPVVPDSPPAEEPVAPEQKSEE